MKRLVSILFYQPGGWGLHELSPAKVNTNGVGFGQAILGGIVLLVVFIVLPLSSGVGFLLRFHLLWLVPSLFLIFSRLVQHQIFRGVPPGSACVLPRHALEDCRRNYQDVMLKVTRVWVIAIILFLLSVEFMKYGLADQWSPFVRGSLISKKSPYWEYGFIELLMLASGVLAISGMVWWPMYAVFEWLSVAKCAKQHEGKIHA